MLSVNLVVWRGRTANNNDIIQGRDKQRDTIFCGGGDDDYVFVDDADVYSGCENVYP